MGHYLTTEELSSRIKYDPRYIRERLKGRFFVEGVHYIRPFGGRKILFLWEAVEDLMHRGDLAGGAEQIPLRKANVRRDA